MFLNCYIHCSVKGYNTLNEPICIKENMCFKNICQKWVGVSENDLHKFNSIVDKPQAVNIVRRY